MKDLYAILGVQPSASRDEIKKAYHRLVRKYHPDMGKESDTERFMEIRNAYGILANRQRREEYDKGLRNSASSCVSAVGQNRNGPAAENFINGILLGFDSCAFPDFQDLFERPYIAEEHQTVEIILSQEEAEKREKISLNIPVWQRCENCGGAGFSFPFLCSACGSTGAVARNRAIDLEIPVLKRSQEVYEFNLHRIGIDGNLRVVFIIRS
ncbi:MAG: DnaJ domain-containing protein [Calditrichia bacterium]